MELREHRKVGYKQTHLPTSNRHPIHGNRLSFCRVSADFPQATDSNPYTDSPLVSFENLDIHTGNIDTLDFKNNLFKLTPSSPGTYSTSSRIWECGRYIGPPRLQSSSAL
jgi:hypothetical protein